MKENTNQPMSQEEQIAHDIAVEKRRKIVEKIAKLKAMAEDPAGNQNEKAAAVARLMELMLEYGITDAEVKMGKGGEIVEVDFTEKPIPYRKPGFPWLYHLLDMLGRNMGCKVFCREDNPYTDRRQLHFMAMGQSADLVNLRYLWEMCVREGIGLAEKYFGAIENVGGYRMAKNRDGVLFPVQIDREDREQSFFDGYIVKLEESVIELFSESRYEAEVEPVVPVVLDEDSVPTPAPCPEYKAAMVHVATDKLAISSQAFRDKYDQVVVNNAGDTYKDPLAYASGTEAGAQMNLAKKRAQMNGATVGLGDGSGK